MIENQRIHPNIETMIGDIEFNLHILPRVIETRGLPTCIAEAVAYNLQMQREALLSLPADLIDEELVAARMVHDRYEEDFYSLFEGGRTTNIYLN